MQNLGKFYIGGAWVAPFSSATTPLINPANEDNIADVPMGDARDVNAAVAAAKAVFPSWSQTTVHERAALLRRLLHLYNEAYDEIAELMTREMGTTIGFSKTAQAAVGRMHIEAAIEALDVDCH
ncbi:aldehyde dehydrogenase family protein [Sulfitobacter sp. NFXS29]|uniref:aldehyde dehydrogenase family protein n=1 Tax=Sulfitobacter sp. NFXS29 TaxID=2818438 RepID=UPI0032DEC3CC